MLLSALKLRPLVALAALCCLLAVALLVSPRAEAAPPADFFGMETPEAVFPAGFGGAQYRAATLDRQRATGVGLIRQPFYWTDIEPQQGVYSFSTYDSFVGEAAKRGIRVMPVLFGERPAYSSRPAGDTQPVHYPPRSDSYGALGDYGAALASRYGPGGSYWAQNPSVPKLPVRSYQVWNEPHIPFYWGGSPSPAQYSQLLLAASPKIKAVDSGAEIVSAGISDVPGLPGALRLSEFIQGMYNAGAKAGFDTLGVHPYAKEPSGVMALVDQARGLMVSNGDSAASLRVTEFSWGSGGTANDIDTDEAGQAAKTRSLLTSFVTRRSQLNLRGAIWWIWRDSGNPPGVWTSYTGLVRQDGSAKPVLAAYRDVVVWSLAKPVPGKPAAPVRDTLAPQLKPVPGKPAAPIRDTLAPQLKVSLRSRHRLGAVRSRGLTVRVRCSEACKLDARLLLSRRVARRFALAPRKGVAIVGRGSGKLRAAGSARLRVKLTRAARRRLRRARSLRLTLRIVGTDGQGNRRTVSRAIMLRR